MLQKVIFDVLDPHSKWHRRKKTTLKTIGYRCFGVAWWLFQVEEHVIIIVHRCYTELPARFRRTCSMAQYTMSYDSDVISTVCKHRLDVDIIGDVYHAYSVVQMPEH